jgi:APA family basic amino acid/polyamine antiporter
MDFMKVMVILGAMCGIITTLNSFFVAGARVLLSMGRAKMIPTAFSKVHKKHKTPVTANTFIVIISIIGSFLGKSLILPIINVCSFGFMLAWFMVGVSALKIKKDYPDLIRPFPVSKAVNIIAVVLSALMMLILLIPGSPGMLSWPLELGIVATWLILGIAFYYTKNHTKKHKKSTLSI